MEANLEDFLREDLWNYFNSDEDAEAEQEYENEYQDAIADEMNDASYYGRNAGEVLEELEENLDGEESEDEEDEETEINNSKVIGYVGEKFALKYLEELFKLNDVDLKVKPHNNDNEHYDIEVSGNLIEVKLSQNIQPVFAEIHFNNEFKYLFLIWKINNNFYFSILSKEEIINNKYATEMHNGRNEDNYKLSTEKIFNKDFLKELAIKLGIDKDLIDLSDERKLEIYEEAENEVIEEYYKDIDMNSLYGKLKMLGSVEKGDLMQDEIYKYLHYFHTSTINNGDGDFDILYKGKRLEIKFSTIYNNSFDFKHIKSEYFDFLFLIGIDEKDVFYFALMTRKDAEKVKDANYFQNGSRIEVSKLSSRINFVNHLTIEDIDNYIETHSN